jgi:hypothetical protein
VLGLLASTLTVVGDHAGDGQALKTVNQILCGVHIAAAAEALAPADALGLDARRPSMRSPPEPRVPSCSPAAAGACWTRTTATARLC